MSEEVSVDYEFSITCQETTDGKTIYTDHCAGQTGTDWTTACYSLAEIAKQTPRPLDLLAGAICSIGGHEGDARDDPPGWCGKEVRALVKAAQDLTEWFKRHDIDRDADHEAYLNKYIRAGRDGAA